TLEIHRLAVRAADTDKLVAHFKVDRARPPDVVANEQVELAIVVVIQPRATGAPVDAAAAYPGLSSDVLEFASAFVVKEPVTIDGRNKHIRAPVVIVIASGHAHAVKADI